VDISGQRETKITRSLPPDGCQALLSIHTNAFLITITFKYNRKQNWWYIVVAKD
jgi:hypothetical protein